MYGLLIVLLHENTSLAFMKLIVHKAFGNFICLAHSLEMGDRRARRYSDTSLSLLQPHILRQKEKESNFFGS